MYKTIRKNSLKRIENIFNTYTKCIAYSLGNSFVGTACDISRAKDRLLMSPSATLSHDVENDKVMVNVNSNLWYELTK